MPIIVHVNQMNMSNKDDDDDEDTKYQPEHNELINWSIETNLSESRHRHKKNGEKFVPRAFKAEETATSLVAKWPTNQRNKQSNHSTDKTKQTNKTKNMRFYLYFHIVVNCILTGWIAMGNQTEPNDETRHGNGAVGPGDGVSTMLPAIFDAFTVRIARPTESLLPLAVPHKPDIVSHSKLSSLWQLEQNETFVAATSANAFGEYAFSVCFVLTAAGGLRWIHFRKSFRISRWVAVGQR